MKKSKSKASAKRSQKTAFNEIREKLVNELTEVTASLGKSSKKLRKTIARGSKKFAKKISKELNITKTFSGGPDTSSAPLMEPKIAGTKKVNSVLNPNPAASKPAVKRARVKTAAPALPLLMKVKKVPVTRAKEGNKPAEPTLK